VTNGSNGESQTFERLKKVAEVVGVVGGMGAAFTGLAFGIGYLATKHHDDMLGVPTTTIDQTSYIRTGALFFTQSLQDFVKVIAGSTPLWLVLLGTLLALLLARWLLGKYAPKILERLGRPTVQRWLVNLGLFLVVALSVVHLPRYLAPLDSANKDLLFERPVAGAEVANPPYDRGEQALHGLYGKQWGVIVGLLLAVILLHHARARIAKEPVPAGTLLVVDRALRPTAYAMLTILLVTTPAIYGVLAMSTSLHCVQLYRPDSVNQDRVLGEP